MTSAERRPHAVALVVSASWLLVHFQILTVGGRPITLALPLAIAVLRLCFHVQIKPLAVLSIICSVLYLALVYFVSSAASVSSTAFAATFIQFATMATLLGYALSSDNRRCASAAVRRGTQWAFMFVVLVSVLQYLAAKRGNFAFYNLWGSHQYQYSYRFSQQFGHVRSQGLYLEPSFDALIIVSALVVILLTGPPHRAPYLVIAAGALGVYTTQSATGFFVLGVIICGGVCSKAGGVPRAVTALIFAVGLIIGAPYLISRISSIGVDGTSAYYRLKVPLIVLRGVLSSNPLGEPLSSVSSVVSGFDLLNGSIVGSSLDNGLALIVFDFGIASVAVIVVIVAQSIRISAALWRVGSRWWTIGLLMVIDLFFTGAIFTPEYALVTVLLVFAIKSGGMQHAASPSDHRGGDAEQFGRLRAHNGQSAATS